MGFADEFIRSVNNCNNYQVSTISDIFNLDYKILPYK